MTDPIADLLTRIRNALMRGKATVNAPYSKLKHELSKLLVKEGFLTSVKKVKKEFDELEITLKYFNEEPVIKELVRDAFNKYRTHLRNNYRDEYLKIKGRGGVDEISTTGGTASFTPGKGMQYATPYAFKKKRKKSNDN